MRLDLYLVEKKMVSTRSQSKTLIDQGLVKVNSQVMYKTNYQVKENDIVIVDSEIYVGRGAFKLESAIFQFGISCENKICLDIGASTGGFTEILLKHGARKVYAVDVGTDQLNEKLKSDIRVINMEGVNIKNLALTEKCDLGVMDLSFISVKKVLLKLREHFNFESELVVLVKPQFEVGKDFLPKDGVVKDEKVQKEVLNSVIEFSESVGWVFLNSIESPIKGKTGNIEYLIHLKIKD